MLARPRSAALLVTTGLALSLVTLSGCTTRVDTLFLGVGLAAMIQIATLAVLNWISRRSPHRRSTQIARTVFVSLVLLTMIGMLVLIVLRSGIGRI